MQQPKPPKIRRTPGPPSHPGSRDYNSREAIAARKAAADAARAAAERAKLKRRADEDARAAAETDHRLTDQRRRRGGGVDAFRNTRLTGVAGANQLSALLGV